MENPIVAAQIKAPDGSSNKNILSTYGEIVSATITFLAAPHSANVSPEKNVRYSKNDSSLLEEESV